MIWFARRIFPALKVIVFEAVHIFVVNGHKSPVLEHGTKFGYFGAHHLAELSILV
jgi:hypothetical protein